jgi:transcription termination factor NusB
MHVPRKFSENRAPSYINSVLHAFINPQTFKLP